MISQNKAARRRKYCTRVLSAQDGVLTGMAVALKRLAPERGSGRHASAHHDGSSPSTGRAASISPT